MPPSKKPESSGISVSSGLSQCYRGSGFSKALQEDDDLDFPLPDIRLEEGAMEDEELTNLNWLHESKNLLKSFGDSVLRSVSPVQDPDDDPPPSPAHSDVPYDARQNPNCKPPLLLQLPHIHGHRGLAHQAPARQGYLQLDLATLSVFCKRTYWVEKLSETQFVLE